MAVLEHTRVDALRAQLEGVREVFAADARCRALADLLFARITPTDLDKLSVAELVAITRAAMQALDSADPATRPTVLASEFSVADASGNGPRSMLAVVNPDRPFLLDSVMNELSAAGIGAELLMHPILATRRDGDGRISAVRDASAAEPDMRIESLIVILTREVSRDRWEQLRPEVFSTLGQVEVAVGDWRAMLERLDQSIAHLRDAGSAIPQDQRDEAIAFATWLRNGQFVFLGMRNYTFAPQPDGAELALNVVEGSGLGILRDPEVHVLRRGRELVALTPEIRHFYEAPQPLFVTKSNIVSRVHRRVHMDYVGIKTYRPDGSVGGELRIVGLFASRAYTRSPSEIPLLRRKADLVVKAVGYVPGSYDSRALANVIDTFPRDELFQIPVATLAAWAPQIVELEVRPRTRVFARPDRFDRFVSILVYVPRERFSTAVRHRISALLASAYGGQVVMFDPYFTQGQLVRVHFIVARFEGRTPLVDALALERQVAEATRNWSDRLIHQFALSGPEGMQLADRFAQAFSASYAETFSVRRAVGDAFKIASLTAEHPVRIKLRQTVDRDPDLGVATLFKADVPLPLSERVPLFENMGFDVIDESTFEVVPQSGAFPRKAFVHAMRLRRPEAFGATFPELAVRIEDAFDAISSGEADDDGFNRLLCVSPLTWRDIAVLRALAAYLRQSSLPFGIRYLADTLVSYPLIAARLVEMFKVRFNPGLDLDLAARGAAAEQIKLAIEDDLQAVPSLDEDRILRALVGLIMATLRTNAFAPMVEDVRARALAFKFDPQAIDVLPDPRPYREIWVYSPRVEGVHLRFAPIARGGLRWSDRAQDFRTEVLGLARAQQVKNTVIVPEGAKGGFYPKQLPRAAGRDVFMAEGIEAYRIFVGTLLDITDTMDGDRVVPRPGVVRHDGDDPYLVVAADKGTATFSDLANEISSSKGHWLGDAFASGGSAGYDHKKMGITARGAWECVKRHFRESSKDIQAEPFTVAGVGDMSGDVFGNGMLLSQHTRLIAAFDHRDIFIDPEPDPALSLAERQRLFALPRSSWQDYDPNLISSGGGVYSRSAKSITLSAQACAALGLSDSVVAPSTLIRAILSAPVDLLWFGGIGTYVRGDEETDAEVGDRANDAIRVAASAVRAKVVGEGANLALTQRARIALAREGCRLNTDFIDNSAGVNSSDIEVNIKLGLASAVRGGRLSIIQRNTLLERMTDDVAQACLRNNRQQALAISLAVATSASELGTYARLMRVLEQRGLLDRDLEHLPTDEALAARVAAGAGLERPEIAVLLSYAKLALSADLIDSPLAGDPALESLLLEYFPPEMRVFHADDILAHPLKRQIIVTRITNSMINRGGPTVLIRLSDETGRGPGEIAKAVMAARELFGLAGSWAAIEALGVDVDASVQIACLALTRESLVDQAAALLRNEPEADLNALVGAYKAAVAEFCSRLADVATARQLEERDAQRDALSGSGVPVSLADDLATLGLMRYAIPVRRLQLAAGAPFEVAATTLLDVADHLGVSQLHSRVRDAGFAETYDRLAVSSALASLDRSAFAAAAKALRQPTEVRGRLDVARRRMSDILSGELSVSRVTVAAGHVRDILEG